LPSACIDALALAVCDHSENGIFQQFSFGLSLYRTSTATIDFGVILQWKIFGLD